MRSNSRGGGKLAKFLAETGAFEALVINQEKGARAQPVDRNPFLIRRVSVSRAPPDPLQKKYGWGLENARANFLLGRRGRNGVRLPPWTTLNTPMLALVMTKRSKYKYSTKKTMLAGCFWPNVPRTWSVKLNPSSSHQR